MMSMMKSVFCGLFVLATTTYGYNNGQALRPAMGWNTWCSDNKCGEDICNEVQIRETANAMKSNGMYDAGFTHVNLDDCWGACERDANGNIQPDSDRFPSGIKNLTGYLHNLGFKFGLYTSAGSSTCSSGTRTNCTVPGSYGHYTQDANTFASWNVDYVKIDWCGKDCTNAQEQHTNFSNALNATGRSIWLELCRGYTYDPTSDYVSQVANSWRVDGDHFDEWSTTVDTIENMANNNKQSGKYNWAYMDFLMTGGQGCPSKTNATQVGAHCPGQTDTEYITEFSLWAIAASPLIVATDVRNMTDIMNMVLLNTEVIAINQENETPAGDVISTQNCDANVSDACQVWTRQMSDGSIAVLLFNKGNSTHNFGITFDQLGMNWDSNTLVIVRDLWSQSDLPDAIGYYNSSVISHGVSFVRLYNPNEKVKRFVPKLKGKLAEVAKEAKEWKEKLLGSGFV